MAKLLVVLISLATLGFLAYYTMYNVKAGAGALAPKQRLENVEQKARQLERLEQQQIDKSAKVE